LVEEYTKSKKGNSWEMMRLSFQNKKEAVEINVELEKGQWLLKTLNAIRIQNNYTTSSKGELPTFAQVKADFETQFADFELFWCSKPIKALKDFGLLFL